MLLSCVHHHFRKEFFLSVCRDSRGRYTKTLNLNWFAAERVKYRTTNLGNLNMGNLHETHLLLYIREFVESGRNVWNNLVALTRDNLIFIIYEIKFEIYASCGIQGCSLTHSFRVVHSIFGGRWRANTIKESSQFHPIPQPHPITPSHKPSHSHIANDQWNFLMSTNNPAQFVKKILNRTVIVECESPTNHFFHFSSR